MPDKIHGYSAAEPVAPIKGSSSNAVVTDKQGEAAETSAPEAKSADQLTLTSSARSLQRIEEALAQTPVVNSSKVAAIKQSISSGNYQIDANSVANKMLQFESGLK